METEGRRYRVLQAVGRGGFGTVYKAELLGSGGFRKPVALKVLNEEASADPEFSGRLRDEARMLGLISHPSVVQVDGLSLLDGRWTVFMEFVDGVDLKRLAKGGAVPLGPALEIAERVADALHAVFGAPQAGGEPLRLLHRDIKPSNIHLTPGGAVKVLDFGVARADFEDRESDTKSRFFGSANYMAPERFDAIDSHAGDVYALAAVLIELVLGRPMGRTSVHPERHEAKTRETLAAVAEVAPEGVVALLSHMLAYEPDERPDAREVWRSLRTLRSTAGSEPWLADWAEAVVRPLVRSGLPLDSDLSGSIVEEGHSGDTLAAARAASLPATPNSSAWRPQARRRAPRRRAPLPTIPPPEIDMDATSAQPGTPDAGEAESRSGLRSAALGVALVLSLGVAGITGTFDGWLAPGSPAASALRPVGTREGSRQKDIDVLAAEVAPLPDPAEMAETWEPAEPSSSVQTGGTPAGSTAPAAWPTSAGLRTLASPTAGPSGPLTPAVAAPTGPRGQPAGETAAPAARAPVRGSRPGATGSRKQGPFTQVLFVGGAREVWLVAGDQRFPAGLVPVGSYTVEADFGNGPVPAGSLNVAPDTTVRLSCRASLKRCIPR